MGNDNLHLAGMAESSRAHCTEAQQMSPKIYVTIGPFTQYMWFLKFKYQNIGKV